MGERKTRPYIRPIPFLSSFSFSISRKLLLFLLPCADRLLRPSPHPVLTRHLFRFSLCFPYNSSPVFLPFTYLLFYYFTQFTPIYSHATRPAPPTRLPAVLLKINVDGMKVYPRVRWVKIRGKSGRFIFVFIDKKNAVASRREDSFHPLLIAFFMLCH